MDGEFIKEVLENPCVAQCIVKHIFANAPSAKEFGAYNKTDVISDVEQCKTFFAFAAISKDERFQEAITPVKQRAQFRMYVRDWIQEFKLTTKYYKDLEESIIRDSPSFFDMDNSVIHNMIHERDAEFVDHMLDFCDYMRCQSAILMEDSIFSRVVHEKIVEMMDDLPDFYEGGSLFLKDVYGEVYT